MADGDYYLSLMVNEAPRIDLPTSVLVDPFGATAEVEQRSSSVVIDRRVTRAEILQRTTGVEIDA
jgi:hypothetical protein